MTAGLLIVLGAVAVVTALLGRRRLTAAPTPTTPATVRVLPAEREVIDWEALGWLPATHERGEAHAG